MSNNFTGGPRDGVAVLMAAAIVAAIAFPQLASALAPFVFPALFLLITFSLSLATDKPLAILTTPEPSVWGILVWQLAFLPLLVILGGWALDLPSDLHLMLVLTAVSSSVFAAPTMAHLFRLNARLPINGMVVSTFLMPIVLLVFDQALDDGGLDFTAGDYGWRVGLFLLLPLGLSMVINRVVQNLPQRMCEGSYGVLRFGAVAALIVFGIGIMDGVYGMLQVDPGRVLTLLSLSVGFSLAALVGTICLFWSLGRDLVLSASILTAHRNIALTYAVVGSAGGQDFAIYVAVSQIPMFLSPLLIRLVQKAASLGGSRAPRKVYSGEA